MVEWEKKRKALALLRGWLLMAVRRAAYCALRRAACRTACCTATYDALDGLEKRLRETKRYMELVVDGSLPVNHEILGHLQDVFNLLPNLNLEAYVKAFAVKTNDAMLVMYLSSLIRAVIALHALIANKQASKEKEKAMKKNIRQRLSNPWCHRRYHANTTTRNCTPPKTS